jgi:RNA polymerase sigma-70 factor, ECF subfamily
MAPSDFERLFEQWRLCEARLIHFLMQRRGLNMEQAKDCVQETFLRAYCNLCNGGEFPREPKAWFYRIASNVCIDLLRKLRRARNIFGQHTDAGEADPADRRAGEPHEVLEKSETRKTVTEALARLSDRERTVVVNHMNGELQTTTARKIGCSTKTVQRLLVQAFDKLRKDEALVACL